MTTDAVAPIAKETVTIEGDILHDPWPYKLMKIIAGPKGGLLLCDTSRTPDRLIERQKLLKEKSKCGEKFVVVKVYLEIIAD